MKSFIVTQFMMGWLKKEFPKTFSLHDKSRLKKSIGNWFKVTVQQSVTELKGNLNSINENNTNEIFNSTLNQLKALVNGLVTEVLQEKVDQQELDGLLEKIALNNINGLKLSKYINTPDGFTAEDVMAKHREIAQNIKGQTLNISDKVNTVLFLRNNVELQLIDEGKVTVDHQKFEKFISQTLNKLSFLA